MNLNKTYHDLIQHYSVRMDLSVPYKKELERLMSIQSLNFYNLVFPYDYVDETLREEIQIVMKDGYPTYFIEGRQMFLPKEWTIEHCGEYIRLLKCEQHKDSPHVYQKGKGKTLIDVGCAEGVFPLMCLDSYKEIHAFDTSDWKDAMSKTFEGIDKVHFHEGLVGYSNPIDDLGLKEVSEIKMDVEGMEYEVLLSAENTIKSYHPKLQVCLYHNRDDFQLLYNLISSFGYRNTTTSPGYLVYPHGKQEPPYFRRGVLYATY